MSGGILTGTTVLLTGALGTLGRAQAHCFHDAGASLLLVDRPERDEDGRQLADKLGASRFVGCDLNDLEELEARFGALADAGRIDILVNNAAIIEKRPFQEFTLAEFEEQMRVNASAVFAAARAVSPSMKARRRGKIINFCSLVLNGRWDDYTPYVASKGAVLGLTRALARELGPFGICVNCVSPGAVVSEAEDRVFGDRLAEYNDWILANQCLKRRIQPEDVAELVLFLAGPGSDLISGQNIGIDGGW